MRDERGLRAPAALPSDNGAIGSVSCVRPVLIVPARAKNGPLLGVVFVLLDLIIQFLVDDLIELLLPPHGLEMPDLEVLDASFVCPVLAVGERSLVRHRRPRSCRHTYSFTAL